MDLSPYIESVRGGVVNASSLADEQTQHVAERLGTAIESSTRLALIQALSDAASAISAELAPSSVEVRMAGQDPEFAVSVPKPESEPTMLYPPSDPQTATEDVPIDTDEEPVARISLRLPQSVKVKVDEVAAADGISTNAWLTRAVMDALAPRDGRREWPRPPMPPGPPLIVPPHGPGGAFVPHGPFWEGGLSGARPDKGAGERPHRHGRVQGWVR